jgi:leucyl-tRNA synthetase
MSKRYGNVVNPDDIVKLYGADTLRVYEMFMGPFDQGIAWSTDNMIGSRRFLERVWRLHDKVAVANMSTDSVYTDPKSVLVTLHKTIKKVTEDIESFSLNTAVSALMILLNILEKQEKVSVETYKTLIILLAPFAPHMADEIWLNIEQSVQVSGTKKVSKTSKKPVQSIYLTAWPMVNKKYLIDDEINIVVQINGKVRANILLGAEEAKNEARVLNRALALAEIQSRIGDKSPDRVIFVPGKIINLVFKSL